ncbi:hypothetical protein VTH06DRAFT_356 [Thermothelomyces fergusii]
MAVSEPAHAARSTLPRAPRSHQAVGFGGNRIILHANVRRLVQSASVMEKAGCFSAHSGTTFLGLERASTSMREGGQTRLRESRAR